MQLTRKNSNLFYSSAIFLIALPILVKLAIFHFQIISFPWPLEYRENTDLWRSYLLSQGRNPYDYENLPSGSSLYGYVYPWLASKLFAYSGVGFPPLRWVTSLAILPMIGVFVWYGLRRQVDLLPIFLIGLIAYATHLIHPGNFLAMPNTLGMTLFCASVLIPPLMRFSNGSLFMAAACSVLGFFTKIYFGIGAFYILLYLLYSRDWRRAAIMSIFLLIAAVVSASIVIFQLPAFYELNLESTGAIVKWNYHVIWPQLRFFIKIYFGLVLLLVAARWISPDLKIFHLKNYYVFGLVISAVLLIKLGGNDGQFFLYFQHLLLPFMVPLCFEVINSSRFPKLVSLLLLLNFLYLYQVGNSQLDLENIRQSFQTIERETEILNPGASILYNAPLSYYAIRQGKTPNEHGQSGTLSHSHGLGHEKYVIQDELIKENIRTAKYAEIFTDEWQPAEIYHHGLIEKYYYRSKEFEIIMSGQRNKTSLWLPKSKVNAKAALEIPQ